MNIKPVIGAACATIAIAFVTPAAAQDQGEVVTPHFEHARPDIPQINDGPKLVYRAGESRYETPGSFHLVSYKGGGGRGWPYPYRWRYPARPGK